ncbi:MAG: CocE/NonD family hydrolase [Myxococcales bacterium]|nr:CocE/NonD family hydrolase [Myxococcales bacterium]
MTRSLTTAVLAVWILTGCGPRAAEVSAPRRGAPAPAADAPPAPPVAPAGDAPALPAVSLPAEASASPPYRYEFGVRVPMRDGITLGATLYRPMTDTPGPVVFVKTPYNAHGYHRWATYFATHGYTTLLVDARGRGNSQGTFRPSEDDGRDGADVVEWIAAQPYCNGKVAMFGGSYDGFGQWATAKHRPPHLSTFVPTASVRFGLDFPLAWNVGMPYTIQWLSFVAGASLAGPVFGDNDRWRQVTAAYCAGAPFRHLDALAGNTTTVFAEWVDHPTFDAYWRARAPSADELVKLDIPILTITGHYDDDQAGAMSYYREHLASAPAAARARHFLLLGPWDHSGTRTPATPVGGLPLGETSQIDIKALHVEWFDWTMRGGPRPTLLTSRVTYYVTGAEAWRHADDLAAIAPKVRSWTLGSTGRADDVFHSGTLDDAGVAGGVAEDTLVLDPRDVRRVERADVEVPVVDAATATPPAGLALVYHSAPLTSDVELGGQLRVTLQVALDVPDTDLSVGLFEVRPGGRTVTLTSQVLRARHRDGLDQSTLVPAGQILEYHFAAANLFARRISAGSRLRLVVGPPLGTSFQRNYQSGGVIADETPAVARVGTLRLVHDDAHVSRLELGVIAPPPASPRPRR